MLAVDVVKAIQKQRNIHQGKVAIVTGDSLNKKKISDIFDKLYGGALIIEKAGKMNEKTVARLNKAMEKDTGELLIVLEEQRKPIDRLLSSNREFRRKFTSRPALLQPGVQKKIHVPPGGADLHQRRVGNIRPDLRAGERIPHR